MSIRMTASFRNDTTSVVTLSNRLTAVLEVGVNMPNAVRYAPLCDTGVSIESPPIFASLLGDDKVNVFSRMVGVWLRAQICRLTTRAFVFSKTDIDSSKAYFDMFHESTSYSREDILTANPIYSLFYNDVYELCFGYFTRSSTQGGWSDFTVLERRRSFYDIFVYYLRFVWNYRDPHSTEELSQKIQLQLWKLLTGIFSKVVTHDDITRGVGGFTINNTPMVRVNKTEPETYQLIFDFYRQRAKANLLNIYQKQKWVNKVMRVWQDLYSVVKFNPGNSGYKRVRDEFNSTMNDWYQKLSNKELKEDNVYKTPK
jgi:hypothetical protein